VPAGGDQDVGQGVRGTTDVGDLVRGGPVREQQLQKSDGVPAVGDRNDHPSPVADRLHVRLLRPQDVLVDGPRQRQRLGLLDAAAAGALDPVAGRQPDDRPAAEVGDQEVHLPGADHPRERGRDRRDGVDRRRGLHLAEEFADVEPASPRPAHGADPRWGGHRERAAGAGTLRTGRRDHPRAVAGLL
jgi:hypothetical protein